MKPKYGGNFSAVMPYGGNVSPVGGVSLFGGNDFGGGSKTKRAMTKNGSSRCFLAKNGCTLKTIAAESVVSRI